MMLTTSHQAVVEFAARVRVHLDDLPADEVDDLVDGLEADLTEQAEESETFSLPDAAEYAAELRAAAGLPERSPRSGTRPPLRDRFSTWRATVYRTIRDNRAGAAVLDFLLALRPVWWIARGWAIFTLLSMWVGRGGIIPGVPWENPTATLLLLGIVLFSVQWGRGRWLPFHWLKAVRTVVSIATVIALPVLIGATLSAVNSAVSSQYYGSSEQPTYPGLSLDNQRVRNIFAYDVDGRPLTDVQLFDQDGRPLTTVGREGQRGDWTMDQYFDAGYGGGPVPVPFRQPGRAALWNVFPLSEANPSIDGGIDPAAATAPKPPLAEVSPLMRSADPSPSPTPNPTTNPDAEGALP
ncbi:MAG: hypothetical protein J0J05_05030 [Microbacterium sp.]|uniref:hypothetical protein n=1 Tax=Microbacterium sp. TaxID=51671 RepID=UPI001ACA9F0B|nr:hypothetical protein [Microbacterium sp.]MBN9153329.1 hypothetical protein [Microbacterium sp.]